MPSRLARLRAPFLTVLLLLSSSHGREDSLFTSSVTYCEPPETLLVQNFYVAYFPKNYSVNFNISAASVQANVNVTANLFLNVYGLKPFNVTLDLCTILGGALCPLPMYNFTGSDSISLPSSITNRIPGIAFSIPDLEGFAQLTLNEVGTGTVKACVQATLSNGWSMHQTAVIWVTAGIALFTLVLAIWPSLASRAAVPFRLLDLLFLYQAIAITALPSLNFPSAYRAFTLNFGWALGLITTSTTNDPFQVAIDQMRRHTGGDHVGSSSGSAIGYVNRKLSPYNAFNSYSRPSFDPPVAASTFTALLSSVFTPSDAFPLLTQQSSNQGDVQTVTATSPTLLQAGIPIYVNSLNIVTANAFMTIFIFALLLAGIVSVLFLLGYVVFYILSTSNLQRHRFSAHLRTYNAFVCSWYLRMGLFMLLPILTFSFYQWVIGDSWLSIFLAVISCLAVAIFGLYMVFVILRRAYKSGYQELYRDAHFIDRYGPAYAQFTAPRYFFFLVILAYGCLKAIFISFAHNSGEAQIILLVILEGLVTLSYILFRPHRTRGRDVFSAFIAIVRLVCTSLTIPFIERLDVQPISRVVIGMVIIALFSVTILLVYIDIFVQAVRFYRAKIGWFNQSAPHEDFADEKAPHSRSWNSLQRINRPNNPTPGGKSSDEDVARPPTSDIESVHSHSHNSRTISLGSLLPRRWTFSPLHSPSHSVHTHDTSSRVEHSNLTSQQSQH